MATRRSSVTLEARPGYVFCRYAGPFEASHLVDVGPAVAAFCAENQLQRVLVDLRDSAGDLTVEDRYRVANTAPYDVPTRIRVAICIRADQGDAHNTWSSAMAERGFTAKSFVDPESALEWLLS